MELEEEDNSKPVKSQSSSSNGDDNDADTAADVDDNNNDASGDAQGDDQQQQQQGPAINAKFRKFADLPISRLTQNGLRDAKVSISIRSIRSISSEILMLVLSSSTRG